MNRIVIFTLMVITGIASIASAQMTNINVNGTSNTTPAPSVVIVPQGQGPVVAQAIPQSHPYVIIESTPNAGMTNLNFNGVALNNVVAPNAQVRALPRTIPRIQPRIVIRPAANGRMTNININNGGRQTVLEPIPNAGAFVIIQPRAGQNPTIVQTPVATTPTVVQTPTVTSVVATPTVVTRPITPTPVTQLTPQPTPTTFAVTPPTPTVTTTPTVSRPVASAQPAPGTIVTQGVNVQPVRQIYGESRWFGATLPSRNFQQVGLGIRYGIIDLFAPLIDGRFDFDYYPIGTNNALEFAINAQFLVASSSSPANHSLYFDVFTGLGPRLYISDNSTALGFGGYIETEMRYGRLAPFLALDATVPIYTFQATPNQSNIAPILIGVEVGVNFYF